MLCCQWSNRKFPLLRSRGNCANVQTNEFIIVLIGAYFPCSHKIYHVTKQEIMILHVIWFAAHASLNIGNKLNYRQTVH